MFKDEQERLAFRKQEFAKINKAGNGYIAFDEWLEWSYNHISEKSKLLDESKADSKMNTGKEDFKAFIIAATKSRHSHEYKELYHFLQDCFTKADEDHDGRVGHHEFDKMIEIAAAAPRRFGFAPSASAIYKNTNERIEARKKMFEAMNTSHSDFIAFDEWLTYCYNHICEKAKALDPSLTGTPPTIGHGCPYGFYKQCESTGPTRASNWQFW
jgi:Ca2+-binding EF-hand superfamily protein